MRAILHGCHRVISYSQSQSREATTDDAVTRMLTAARSQLWQSVPNPKARIFIG